MQKKFDTNQIQCSQLLLHNQELKTKCDLLQEKLDNLERNNIRLIQRWTQQVKFS
jgi:predicted nuclease with TOPRIM domain